MPLIPMVVEQDGRGRGGAGREQRQREAGGQQGEPGSAARDGETSVCHGARWYHRAPARRCRAAGFGAGRGGAPRGREACGARTCAGRPSGG